MSRLEISSNHPSTNFAPVNLKSGPEKESPGFSWITSSLWIFSGVSCWWDITRPPPHLGGPDGPSSCRRLSSWIRPESCCWSVNSSCWCHQCYYFKNWCIDGWWLLERVQFFIIRPNLHPVLSWFLGEVSQNACDAAASLCISFIYILNQSWSKKQIAVIVQPACTYINACMGSKFIITVKKSPELLDVGHERFWTWHLPLFSHVNMRLNTCLPPLVAAGVLTLKGVCATTVKVMCMITMEKCKQLNF